MPDDSGSGLSRRQVLAASGTGIIAATATAVPARAAGTRSRSGAPGVPGDGTPEQIHLTWGDDPARSVVVSWASPAQAVRPRVRIGQRVIPAEERSYTDGLSGVTVWTYHARVHGLRPGAASATGRLLRVLFLRFSAVPSGSTGARRRGRWAGLLRLMWK